MCWRGDIGEWKDTDILDALTRGVGRRQMAGPRANRISTSPHLLLPPSTLMDTLHCLSWSARFSCLRITIHVDH